MKRALFPSPSPSPTTRSRLLPSHENDDDDEEEKFHVQETQHQIEALFPFHLMDGKENHLPVASANEVPAPLLPLRELTHAPTAPNSASSASSMFHRPRPALVADRVHNNTSTDKARMLASEAKSIEVAVLKLYDSNTTSDEIDEIVFGNYEEHAVFENSLLKLQGVCEVRSLFQLNRSVFWSFNIVRPVKVGLWLGGKEGEGAKLLLDFKVEYQMLPFTPKFVIHQFTHLLVSSNGTVAGHKDDWSLSSVIENLPFGTTLYPFFRRAQGMISSSLGAMIQPSSIFYKKILTLH